MKKVLIVEDDGFKRDALVSVVSEILFPVEIDNVSDVRSAIVAVNEKVFDLIIIDMALPSHPVISGGGSPLSLLTGGLEVLFELRSLGRKDECIVITQYQSIEISGTFFPVSSAAQAIQEHFFCKVLACIEYLEESTTWKVSLTDILRRI